LVDHPAGGVLLVGGTGYSSTAGSGLILLRHASAAFEVLNQSLAVNRTGHVAVLVPDTAVSCT
jgi:hypothetical protein